MLARSTVVPHPVGKALTTPLLVPSFSSKGFGTDPRGRPEVGRQLRIAEQFITDSMLLSAYDIFQKHVRAPRKAITEITFVDSGGYETTSFQDLSEYFIHTVSTDGMIEAPSGDGIGYHPDEARIEALTVRRAEIRL